MHKNEQEDTVIGSNMAWALDEYIHPLLSPGIALMFFFLSSFSSFFLSLSLSLSHPHNHLHTSHICFTNKSLLFAVTLATSFPLNKNYTFISVIQFPTGVILARLLQEQCRDSRPSSMNRGIALVPILSVGVDMASIGVVSISALGLVGVIKGSRRLMNLVCILFFWATNWREKGEPKKKGIY